MKNCSWTSCWWQWPKFAHCFVAWLCSQEQTLVPLGIIRLVIWQTRRVPQQQGGACHLGVKSQCWLEQGITTYRGSNLPGDFCDIQVDRVVNDGHHDTWKSEPLYKTVALMLVLTLVPLNLFYETSNILYFLSFLNTEEVRLHRSDMDLHVFCSQYHGWWCPVAPLTNMD